MLTRYSHITLIEFMEPNSIIINYSIHIEDIADLGSTLTTSSSSFKEIMQRDLKISINHSLLGLKILQDF